MNVQIHNVTLLVIGTQNSRKYHELVKNPVTGQMDPNNAVLSSLVNMALRVIVASEGVLDEANGKTTLDALRRAAEEEGALTLVTRSEDA